jgi:thioredoxin 1
MASTIHVTTEDFESKVLRSAEPIVVDFWAEWCAPCQMMAPVLEQLADEMQGQVSFAKLNVDENPDPPARYEVEALPTLLVFAQGKKVGRIVGFAPKAHIQHSLEQIISRHEAQLDRSAA